MALERFLANSKRLPGAGGTISIRVGQCCTQIVVYAKPVVHCMLNGERLCIDCPFHALQSHVDAQEPCSLGDVLKILLSIVWVLIEAISVASTNMV